MSFEFKEYSFQPTMSNFWDIYILEINLISMMEDKHLLQDLSGTFCLLVQVLSFS